MRAILICAPVVLLVLSPPTQAQEDVHQLLEQVAAACRDLYRHGYAVDIQHHQASHPQYSSGGSSMQNDRMTLPIPPMPLAGDGAVDRILLARSGRNLRFEKTNSAVEVWQWTTDGNIVWCYRRDLNAYTKVEAAAWPERLGPGPGLPGEEWKYFAKFIAIAEAADHARIVKDDVAPDRYCSGASVLIELNLNGGSEPVKEYLRVLTRTHLPCHTTITRTRKTMRGAPVDSTETISWRFRERVAPRLFVFAPRRRAQLVTRFPRE